MRRAQATLCAGMLAALAGIHVYWASGGEAFAAAAIPTKRGPVADVPAVSLFQPGPASTLAVATGLGVAALVVLRAGFARQGRGLARVVSLVFFARAVGELRYVGFFKRVRGTEFSRRDDWIYSPLCLAIAKLAAGAAK